jgi:hypothetical protein
MARNHDSLNSAMGCAAIHFVVACAIGPEGSECVSADRIAGGRILVLPRFPLADQAGSDQEMRRSKLMMPVAAQRIALPSCSRTRIRGTIWEGWNISHGNQSLIIGWFGN